MEILLIRLFEALLMPPGLMLVMMLAGSLIVGRFYRSGKLLVIGGFALLFISSLPVVPRLLLAMLEQMPAVTPFQLKQKQIQAIVILGGGRYAKAPEYNGKDTVSKYALVRLRYGAYLHRQSGLPVLVTGGKPFDRPVPEAELMRDVLTDEFHIPVEWVEGRAKNTWENAEYSYQILNQAGINRIALVSHAWHMPRAVSAFEQFGFEVVPAPTAYTTSSQPLILDFVPNAGALDDTRKALHEILGRMWYAMRY